MTAVPELVGPPDPRKRRQAMADLAKAAFKVLHLSTPGQHYKGAFIALKGPYEEGVALAWTGERLTIRACGYEIEFATKLMPTSGRHS